VTSPAITHPDIQISGDVRIDPRAVIAPGVILQAAAGCHVAIAPGACIGAGSILQAHGGNIEIHNGAVLGAGCLVIGRCSVGENACIGYGSTIFQASVLAATLLLPHSLVGDPSRQGAEATTETLTHSPEDTKDQQDPWQEENDPDDPPTAARRSPPAPENSTPPFAEPQTEVIPTAPDLSTTPETKEKTPVVGQVYINQLLMTLFPHQNNLNNLNKSDRQ
jgi:carbon dioxide concentrating mechanism protein CcmN